MSGDLQGTKAHHTALRPAPAFHAPHHFSKLFADDHDKLNYQQAWRNIKLRHMTYSARDCHTCTNPAVSHRPKYFWYLGASQAVHSNPSQITQGCSTYSKSKKCTLSALISMPWCPESVQLWRSSIPVVRSIFVKTFFAKPRHWDISVLLYEPHPLAIMQCLAFHPLHPTSLACKPCSCSCIQHQVPTANTNTAGNALVTHRWRVAWICHSKAGPCLLKVQKASSIQALFFNSWSLRTKFASFKEKRGMLDSM